MFGYVMADADKLSESDSARYRAAYCGVCHSLCSRFAPGRLLLSFDMAFLSILLDSAYEPAIEKKELRCFMHPLKKRECHISENSAYAADMTTILAYHKAIDDINDDRSAKAHMLKSMLEKPYAAACERYPDRADAIEARLNELFSIEQRNCPGEDTDAASGCFGALLGEVFDVGEFGSRLRRFGESLGRFIYIMDAWEDAEADKKRGRYNPLVLTDTFDADTGALLNALMIRCTDEFEKLPLEKDMSIMRNVLYSGIWTRYNIKTHSRAGKERQK